MPSKSLPKLQFERKYHLYYFDFVPHDYYIILVTIKQSLFNNYSLTPILPNVGKHSDKSHQSISFIINEDAIYRSP